GLGVVRSVPETRALFLEIMREVVAVGRSRGVALPEDYAENRLAFCDKLPPGTNASMRNDLERGNRLELDWLSGAVIRLGAERGVPTPANLVVYAALKPHANGALKSGG